MPWIVSNAITIGEPTARGGGADLPASGPRADLTNPADAGRWLSSDAASTGAIAVDGSDLKSLFAR
jgi:hypothetical protein